MHRTTSGIRRREQCDQMLERIQEEGEMIVKRKAGQTWHYVIGELIKDEESVTPKEISEKLDIHHQKVTSILLSLGWIRVPGNSTGSPVQFIPSETKP